MNGLLDPFSASAFYSPDDFETELNKVFHSGWHLAGFDFEFSDIGDYQCIQLGAQSWILCNTHSGLECFANVCRHRGHPITEGRGNESSFVCPYHRWRYDLNGQLDRAPNQRAIAPFDAAGICLPKGSVFVATPLVFISPNERAPGDELIASFKALASAVQSLGPAMDELSHCETRSYSIKCNWKVALDNYLECYHCGGGHPSFCNIMKLRSYAGSNETNWSLQTAEYCGERRLEESTPKQWGFFTSFPANIINITPGLNQLNLMQVVPTSPNTCRVDLRTWRSAHFDHELAKDMNEIIIEVKQEDIVFCEAVQKGIESGQFERAIIMDDPQQGASSERALRVFRDFLVRRLEV